MNAGRGQVGRTPSRQPGVRRRAGRARARLVLLAAAATLALSAAADCGSGGEVRRFPLAEPLWDDPDRTPVDVQPEPYYSPFGWDAADQTLFRPVTRVFAVDPPGAATNVNAFDEVPNSSWFENRAGLGTLTVEQARQGACPDDRIDWDDPWTVTAAKPNGANPGFIIRAGDGRHYLLKFDGHLQPERATTADVFGSRLYWAVGYLAPCNFIVTFDPAERLVMDPDAQTENDIGEDVPMTEQDVDKVLAAAVVMPDGRLRASASLFLPGRPLGPWRYQGTRSDDPNDVVPHQDRRELRGGRLLAAWINHFDAREMNTLSMWVEADGQHYVRHQYIDFGDSLGSDWEIEYLTRRLGFANYFDISQVAEDFLTLGLLRRPWDEVQRSEVAPAFGYFDAAHFDPEAWEPGYPNPAFVRMQPEDGAWMARILAHLTDAHVRAMLDEAQLSDPEADAELLHTLLARRDRILDQYLRVRSPLAHFTVERADHPSGVVLDAAEPAGQREGSDLGEASGEWLCFTDLGVQAGVFEAESVRYESRMSFVVGTAAVPIWRHLHTVLGRDGAARVCIDLAPGGIRPRTGAAEAGVAPTDYAVLDLFVTPEPGAGPIPPARLHFYDVAGEGFRLVGVERPGS